MRFTIFFNCAPSCRIIEESLLDSKGPTAKSVKSALERDSRRRLAAFQRTRKSEEGKKAKQYSNVSTICNEHDAGAIIKM